MEFFNQSKYVKGDPNVLVPAHLNFGKYMLDLLRRFDNEVALEDAETGEKLTFKEFLQYAVDLAVSLTKLGVRKGDVVALGSETRINFLPITLAIIFTGATYTPYELVSGKTVLRHKMSITKPKYFICSKRFWEIDGDVLENFETIKMFISLDEGIDFGSKPVVSIKSLTEEHYDIQEFEPAPVQGQIDTALILYSSGTTGLPKGIQLTHLNFILNGTHADFKDVSFKTVFNTAKWFHIFDTFLTYKMLCLGKKVVYITNKETENYMKAFEKCKVEVAMISPVHVSLLSMREDISDYDLSSLKIIYASTTTLHVKTIRKILERIPSLENVLQLYIMTEATTITSEAFGTKGARPGSVGMVYPGVVVKVVNPETEEPLGPNQHGEIRVKGPVVMKGYIDVDPATYLDSEGFFKTGDSGYYDDDGYFFIVERLKEIIDYRGHKIAPLQLEAILLLHPAVLDTAVVGKTVPIYGEEPTAFVVQKPGVTVSEQELIEFLSREVTKDMQLRGGVNFIQEIPRNPTGKIMRRQLREKLNEKATK